MKNKFSILIQVLLIISFPILFLLTDVEIVAFDYNFFKSKYEEYNIMEVTGIEKDDLMMITNELMKYLRGDREDIIIYANVNGEREQIFEEKEIMHLYDVRNLFLKGYKIRNLLIIISLISIGYLLLFNIKKIRRTLIISAIIPLVLIIILSLLIMTDFYKYFTYFHLILFDNDLWLLDPETDILIQMYPLEFFNSIALRIIKMFFLQMSLILLILLIIPRIKKIAVKYLK